MYPILLDGEMVQLWQTAEAVMDNPRWAAAAFAVRLLYCAPMRVNELRHVKLEDIQDNLIWVSTAKGGKTRHVEIVPEFLPYVEWYLKFHTRKGQTWLFPARQRSVKLKRGQVANLPVSARTIERWWTNMLALAGVRHVVAHSVRRSFIGWFKDRLNVSDMKDQLGHARIKTTEEHYWISIPGRRFSHDKPDWVQEMESGASKLRERLDRGGLRIIGGRKNG